MLQLFLIVAIKHLSKTHFTQKNVERMNITIQKKNFAAMETRMQLLLVRTPSAVVRIVSTRRPRFVVMVSSENFVSLCINLWFEMCVFSL